MLGVVILLKDNPGSIETVLRYGWQQPVFQYRLVAVLIHSPLNFDHDPRTFGCHTGPDHYRSAAVLHGLFDMVRLKTFSVADPVPTAAVRLKAANFCLIGPDHTLPILDGEVAVALSKS